MGVNMNHEKWILTQRKYKNDFGYMSYMIEYLKRKDPLRTGNNIKTL